MRESQSPSLPTSHDEIWELIPWYVNGSLPPAEADAVRRYSSGCEICAAEIERQRLLAEGVANLEPAEAPPSHGWESLRARIEADERARAPSGRLRRWFPSLQVGFGLAGTLAAVLLVSVLVMPPSDNGFETFTDGKERGAQTIKFQTVPGVEREALDRVLASQGLTLVAEPSETGVYTATAPAGANLEAAANALMATPEVMFAAPEGVQ